jgi:hypothetical protein
MRSAENIWAFASAREELARAETELRNHASLRSLATVVAFLGVGGIVSSGFQAEGAVPFIFTLVAGIWLWSTKDLASNLRKKIEDRVVLAALAADRLGLNQD